MLKKLDAGIIFIIVLTLGLGFMFYKVNQKEYKIQQQATVDRIHACIDRGGYPVVVETYVKGIGEGHVCIKSIETIN